MLESYCKGSPKLPTTLATACKVCKFLVDKNGEELSEIIRNKISEVPHFLDQDIFSVIEQMAAYASNNVKRVVIKP